MKLGTLPEAKVPREDELERDEKFFSGRVIVVAIDHGPNSRAAFTWALDQFVTHADTVHLLHVLPKSAGGSGGSDTSPMYGATQLLFDRLRMETQEKKCNVRVVPLLRVGEAGKEIVAEASRSKAVAVIMGCRGLSTIKSLLVGSSTDYCLRYSPVPLIIVPRQFRSDEDHHNSLWNSASDADPSIPAAVDEEEPEDGLKMDGR